MLQSLQNIMRIPELRKKLLITMGLLFVYRIGAYVTLPGVDGEAIKRITEQVARGSGEGAGAGLAQALQFASMITGGQLQQCTLFALGIMPYISASIVFSLLVKVIPQLEAIVKEGESGRRKITQYTRYATVGLCLFQSFIIIQWMKTGLGGEHIVDPMLSGTAWFHVTTIFALTTGTVFLMWIGEQITEFGIGNGISLIIMAGIVDAMPSAFYQFYRDLQVDEQNIPLKLIKFGAFVCMYLAVVIAVVTIQRGQRRIPIQQQKHTRGRRVYGGQRHYMPLLVNAAGVMPVIFAQSLIILPSALFGAMGVSFLQEYLARGDGFWYICTESALIILFTYFWNTLTFNPSEIANQMKENGSFIPGIRPGKRTADYLEDILTRVTLVGSLFLVGITLLPIIFGSAVGIRSTMTRFIGGTSILIVVGVALDVVQKIESHLLMRHYEGFMKTGRIRGRRG